MERLKKSEKFDILFTQFIVEAGIGAALKAVKSKDEKHMTECESYVGRSIMHLAIFHSLVKAEDLIKVPDNFDFLWLTKTIARLLEAVEKENSCTHEFYWSLPNVGAK